MSLYKLSWWHSNCFIVELFIGGDKRQLAGRFSVSSLNYSMFYIYYLEPKQVAC